MDAKKTSVTQEYEYLYIIGGVIPEAMPSVAYRRIGQAELVGRKIIKCPYCRESLTDVERHTTVQIYRRACGVGKKPRPIPGQMFKMCGTCKSEVGIVMTAG